MMPIDPAKAVMMVRPFLVIRLLNESDSAVSRLMDERRLGPFSADSSAEARDAAASRSSALTGSVSSTTRPSRMRTMRVA